MHVIVSNIGPPTQYEPPVSHQRIESVTSFKPVGEPGNHPWEAITLVHIGMARPNMAISVLSNGYEFHVGLVLPPYGCVASNRETLPAQPGRRTHRQIYFFFGSHEIANLPIQSVIVSLSK